jgi:hypothetical protein
MKAAKSKQIFIIYDKLDGKFAASLKTLFRALGFSNI